MTTQREADFLAAAYASGITSPKELANLMGQVSHESGGLTRMEESFRYPGGLKDVPVASARNSPDGESAHQAAMDGDPKPLAELMYGGKMGNAPGEGYTYRGRGYIQLTGHDNYEAMGKALGVDLVKHPELAAQPEVAARIAVKFWEDNIPANAREDVAKATHVINKGDKGLEDREQRAAAWEAKLTPEVMAGLARGEMTLPIAAEREHGHHAPVGGALRQGSQGDAVNALQTQLGALGYLKDAQGHAPTPDGHFGPQTAAALRAFQHDHSLQADAVAGSATQQALQAAQHPTVNQPGHAGAPPLAGAVLLNDPAHPDNALYCQARSHVHQLDASLGRTPDGLSDNLAGVATVQARRDGLERIDQVALSTDGQRLWAVQTPPGRTDHLFDLRTSVPTEAVHTPLAQSSAQWPQAMEQFQSQQQAQNSTQAQSVEQAQQQGPTMSR
ncbi:XVIPCD domain-containing protein [Luteibacter sp. 9135]|uniref:XVIPCD domain-containing protein n=1 Tax=Luteibacter sp. 9135 TaxID=1500893 RepID=UPI00068CF2A7|nr:XVIPCD domain-containing protein [Luteibacter sp. 9135]